MTSSPHQTDASLIVRRTMAAPAHVVYRAWTSPAMVTQWSWGSQHETIDVSMDCRPGGAWHHEIRNRDNGERWTFDGVFETVVPDRRLVHTFFWRSESGTEEGPSLVEIDFLDQGGDTTEVIITHRRLADPSREGTREGWRDILELVEGLVQRAQSSSIP
jgi:uncharacterized protein YndB with AHSA1/START domain